MTKNPIHIGSEIGKLNSVVLHRPGRELLNVTPEIMGELLFDEIPFLDAAREEHDAFAQVLRDNGVEVFYLEKLAAEAITSQEIRDEFIATYLDEAGIIIPRERLFVEEIFKDLNNQDLVLRMMEGTRKSEIPSYTKKTLAEMVGTDNNFVIQPMPNLYFTRDPFSFIGNGVAVNHMWSNTRRRETLFGKMIFDYHPMFKDAGINRWYDRTSLPSIEGGDIIVLSDKVVAVGVSQRTKAQAVEKFAENLLSGDAGYETVLALTIPQKHSFMHLDTVFTMVDKDLFTLHPEVDETLCVFSLQLENGEIVTREESHIIEKVLMKFLEIDEVHLIREGSGTVMDAVREQWSDGYNTLAIAPREVVVYDRNTLTNAELDKFGAKIHVIKSGELSRGRGGPRCMSMPINRDDVK
ncbi:MAG: arginine deiminase [Bacillota bacterium]|nr:arginine deiminase [Bacillota bacterium]